MGFSYNKIFFLDEVEKKAVVKFSVYPWHNPCDIFINKTVLIVAKQILCFRIAVHNASKLFSHRINCNHTLFIEI